MAKFIKQLSNKDLLNQIRELDDMITNIGVFGVRDIKLLAMMEQEAMSRGLI